MTTDSSGVIGVFARPNHPIGWGFPPDGQSGPYGKAHGYSVLLVSCRDDDELGLVEDRLNDWRSPFHGRASGGYSEGYLGEWFGGQFDLIAKLNDTPENRVVVGPWQPRSLAIVCKGDNRFVAHFTAEEVLHSPVVEKSA